MERTEDATAYPTSDGNPKLMAKEGMPRATDWRTYAFIGAVGTITGIAVLAYIANAPLRSARINDFYSEAWPAYTALAHGHLLGFLRLGPVYIGSLILRAPFALVPSIWRGGPREIYVASAVPCMIALAGLSTWLAAQPRRNGSVTWASRLSPVVCCAINPLILICLYDGHPEEILGAVLCVGAVVVAIKDRSGWAGFLLGLAVVNKSWALVAVPVVLAVAGGDRRRIVAVSALTMGAVLIPVVVVPKNGVSAGASGALTGTTFTPPQLLWWLGPHNWLVREARPMIVLVSVLCAGLWWLRRVRSRSATTALPDAMALLALVMLLRAALDPWNNLYYHLPFLLALMTYEITSKRMPSLAVLYSLLLLAVVPIRGVPHMSFDMRAATYAMIVLPTIGWLAAKLYLRPNSLNRLSATLSPWRRRDRLAATHAVIEKAV